MVSWVESVLYRSCTASHNGSLGSRWSIGDHDLSDLSEVWSITWLLRHPWSGVSVIRLSMGVWDVGVKFFCGGEWAWIPRWWVREPQFNRFAQRTYQDLAQHLITLIYLLQRTWWCRSWSIWSIWSVCYKELDYLDHDLSDLSDLSVTKN